MLLVLRLLLAGMLLFLLTDMPGSFVLFVRWYALVVAIYSVIDTHRQGLLVHAFIWILVGGIMQPVWIVPLDAGVWKGIWIATAVWCAISVVIEEIANYRAARRAKADANLPVQKKAGVALKGERVKRG